MNGHGQGCEFFHWVMALLSVSWNRLYTESFTQGEKEVCDAKKDTNLSFPNTFCVISLSRVYWRWSRILSSWPWRLEEMLPVLVLVEYEKIMKTGGYCCCCWPFLPTKILSSAIRVAERNGMTSCQRHFLGNVLYSLSSYHMGKNYVYMIY